MFLTGFPVTIRMAEAGYVKYVEGEWNKAYFTELEQFDGSRKYKRDQVDATSDGFNQLRTQQTIPSFTITSFTQENRFSRD